MKYRIWCEFLKPHDVMQTYMLELFKKYKIHLQYKLEYADPSPDFFEMIQLYNKNKIPVSIWATLGDKQGYWINERNAALFESYIKDLVEKIEEKGCRVDGICIDMEPPLKQVQALMKQRRFIQTCLAYIRMATVNVNARRYLEAVRKLQSLQKYLKGKSIESFAAFLQQVFYDIRFNTNIIQNALETPVFSINWDKYNAMYYATMMRDALKTTTDDELDYKIFHELSFLRQKIGESLCVSVGVTNTGKLGKEAGYQDDATFIKDVGIVKAAGIDDISLFCLDGIINPKTLEKFIEMMVNAEPCTPEKIDSILKAEKRIGKFIKIAKGYYNLYKI